MLARSSSARAEFMGRACANATAGAGSDGQPCSGGVSRSTRDHRDLTAGSFGSITCGDAAWRWNLARCCVDLQNPRVSNGGRRRPRTHGPSGQRPEDLLAGPNHDVGGRDGIQRFDIDGVARHHRSSRWSSSRIPRISATRRTSLRPICFKDMMTINGQLRMLRFRGHPQQHG